MGRFDYIRYDNDSAEMQAQFKEQLEKLEFMVQSKLDPGRPQSLIFTKLEEVYMWIGKAIRDWQLKRTGSAELQEGRTDG